MSKNKKAEKAKQYLATIIPVSGSPFEVEVKEDSDGTITYNEKTWKVASNSVYSSKKQRRIILPEECAESMHGGLLEGKFYMTAALFFYYIKMKLLEQLFNLQNRKPWYKSGSTWAIVIAIGCVALAIAWLVIDTNGSLERIADTIGGLGPETGQAGDGQHNDIAPEGK